MITLQDIFLAFEPVFINNLTYNFLINLKGSGRIDVYCFDGVKRMATIRGKIRKKVWIGVVRLFNSTKIVFI